MPPRFPFQRIHACAEARQQAFDQPIFGKVVEVDDGRQPWQQTSPDEQNAEVDDPVDLLDAVAGPGEMAYDSRGCLREAKKSCSFSVCILVPCSLWLPPCNFAAVALFLP
ncbi:hypothetical protein [Janthinobacterium sp. MDB2-8]|uniref:hypothetical protein n=1 Tax=Janthinobacterium sp. MDB2-8 TaxID=1259338 RepID=UPI003F278F97